MTLLEQLRASALRCTAERLEAIPHQTLTLDPAGDDDADRPDLTLWAGVDEDMVPQMTLHLEPDYGKQGRFLDLRPSEARALANLLTTMADEIDGVTACSAQLNLQLVKDD